MERHEARAAACPEQLPLDHILAVPIGAVSRTGIVQQVTVPPRATTAQRANQPLQQFFQCVRPRVPFGLRRSVHLAIAHHVAQCGNVLGYAFGQPVHRLPQQVCIRLDPGGTRGFEAAANAGLLAEFRADEPGQNPAKIAIQPAVRRQRPFAEQACEVVQPVQLWWQETGQITPLRQRAAGHRKRQLRTQLPRCRRIGQAADQRRLFHRLGHVLLHRQGLSLTITAKCGGKRDGILQPVGLERTGQVGQCRTDASLCTIFQPGIDDLRQCRAKIEPPGARRQKTGPMGRILHGIGKGNQLLVGVEARTKQLLQHHGRQAGRLRAHDGERVAAIAERAVMAGIREPCAVARALAQIGSHQHIHQRGRQTGGIVLAGAVRYGLRVLGAAQRAHSPLLKNRRKRAALQIGQRRRQEQKTCGRVLGKECLIKSLQVGIERAGVTRAGSPPPHDPAVTAMHDR